MNTNKKERRVVNILKVDFDKIKKYCDDKSLNLPKWLVRLALKEIESNN